MRFVLVVLLLAGCAETRWDKIGPMPEAFQRELQECKEDAAASPSRLDYETKVDECLAFRGWRDW
jgi:hypothetical protein